MSDATLRQIPDLVLGKKVISSRGTNFRSVQVDLLLTQNPLFKIVAEKFATNHRFAELEIPTATVEGLVVLKLYALPSLYRQMDLDRAALYETDITLLIARHSLALAPLAALVEQYVELGDKKELQKIISECRERANLLRNRAGR